MEATVNEQDICQTLPTSIIKSSNFVPFSIPLVTTGKVRDLYSLGPKELLFVASDRISAFDVSLNNGIPCKGRLLNQLTAFWIDFLTKAIPGLRTHLITTSLPNQIVEFSGDALEERCSVVQRLKIFPIEAIVRGYLTGSAWAEYQKSGKVHSQLLPTGLKECERIPGGPIFTPSTKASPGGKDENISRDRAAEIIGQQYTSRIEELALSIYDHAAKYAFDRGIIIADSKFEFGLDTENNEVILVDEVLTPDSSRFWETSTYKVGRSQKSFDKQYLRDWLVARGLKGQDDVTMPKDVVEETSKRYQAAFEMLTKT